MAKHSAGLLPYRWRDGRLEVFLVHPGGPFWAGREAHAWSVAKGEVEPDEALDAAARREFCEETGLDLPGPALALEPVTQPGGKVVHAWAVEAGALDPAAIQSNAFTIEWPPRSGRMQDFPEVDRAGWFALPEARERLHKGQDGLLDQLAERLGPAPGA